MAGLEGLPPLREVVAAHGLRADKRFGQHYLFDQNLTDRIAREAGPLDGVCVVEVGPGPGGLTRSLLRAGAAHVIAIEKDTRFLPALGELREAAGGRLTLHEGDALETDIAAISAPGVPGLPIRIISNLPYNVGTALLVDWLLATPFWQAMTLMFQREVAERIVAAPGGAAYGRLAVLTALRADASLIMRVPAAAFTPPPQVESAVVQLAPRADAYAHTEALSRVTAAAFGQRRKMLRRSLKQVFEDVDDALARVGLSGDMRPETVPPNAFARLADQLV